MLEPARVILKQNEPLNSTSDPSWPVRCRFSKADVMPGAVCLFVEKCVTRVPTDLR